MESGHHYRRRCCRCCRRSCCRCATLEGRSRNTTQSVCSESHSPKTCSRPLSPARRRKTHPGKEGRLRSSRGTSYSQTRRSLPTVRRLVGRGVCRSFGSSRSAADSPPDSSAAREMFSLVGNKTPEDRRRTVPRPRAAQRGGAFTGAPVVLFYIAWVRCVGGGHSTLHTQGGEENGRPTAGSPHHNAAVGRRVPKPPGAVAAHLREAFARRGVDGAFQASDDATWLAASKVPAFVQEQWAAQGLTADAAWYTRHAWPASVRAILFKGARDAIPSHVRLVVRRAESNPELHALEQSQYRGLRHALGAHYALPVRQVLHVEQNWMPTHTLASSHPQLRRLYKQDVARHPLARPTPTTSQRSSRLKRSSQ